MGSEEFINRKPRYCLWLVGATPAVLKSMPLVMKRVEACREARLGGVPDKQKLADLYNEALMPPELRKAHQANDRAVMVAYGFSMKDMTEAACVAELMRMYQELMKHGK